MPVRNPRSYINYLLIIISFIIIIINGAILVNPKIIKRTSRFVMKFQVDRTQGWYPHQVGNYWINRDFIPCDINNKTWYWEVIKLKKTDSAEFFLMEKLGNPCDTTESVIYYQWYAYTNDHKLYKMNDKFEFIDLEADFSLTEGESFIRQGVRYTLLERTENKLLFEYDIYSTGTLYYKFEKGIGNDLNWEEVKINGRVYKSGF